MACTEECKVKVTVITLDAGEKTYLNPQGNPYPPIPTRKQAAEEALRAVLKRKTAQVSIGPVRCEEQAGCRCIPVGEPDLEALPGRPIVIEARYDDGQFSGGQCTVRAKAHKRVGIQTGVCDDGT